MADKTSPSEQIERVNDARFEAEIDKLIAYAEDLRMDLMRKHRGRAGLATIAFILFVLLGAIGFGWFLFMQGRVDIAVMCVMISIAIPFMIHLWSEKPLLEYKTQYKEKFMPKLAHALGGLRFFPTRGIGRAILSKTGVLPQFETYKAEDCFMGNYKGVKVIFSEARLFQNQRQINALFDGIFVLLEAPSPIFDGHTILTSDHGMIQQYGGKRWQKLSAVQMENIPAEAHNFRAYSSNPLSAQKILTETLLKELSEASLVFNKAPVTCVMFQKKYIFLMIPYAQDMFESSNIHIPVKTKQHAQQCRKEINQILEIIDMFEIFDNEEDPLSAVEPSGNA